MMKSPVQIGKPHAQELARAQQAPLDLDALEAQEFSPELQDEDCEEGTPLCSVDLSYAGVRKRLDSAASSLRVAIPARKRPSVHSGPAAKASLQRWQLPGDDKVLKDMQPARNLRPLAALVPTYILIFFIEGIGYAQETPTRDAHGRLYKGVEWSACEDDLKFCVAANYRNDRINLYKNGSLTCQFGEPAELWLGHGNHCPIVMGFHANHVRWIWPVVALVTLVVCICKGRAMQKADKRQDHSDLKVTKSPLGTYLRIYSVGYADVHIWAMFGLTLLYFVYTNISYLVVAASPGKCISFGNWANDKHLCVPVAAVDTQPIAWALMGAALLLGCSLQNSGTVQERAAAPSPSPHAGHLQELDSVLVAAVRMKCLVHEQLVYKKKSTKASAYVLLQLPKVLCTLIAELFSSTGVDKQIQDACEDQCADFMDSFSNELDSICDLLRDTTAQVQAFGQELVADSVRNQSARTAMEQQLEAVRVEVDTKVSAMQAAVEAKAREAQKQMELKLSSTIRNAEELRVPKSSQTWMETFSMGAPAIFGSLSGLVLFAMLLVQPFGWNGPVRDGGLLQGGYAFSGGFKYSYNNSAGCEGLGDPWCAGQPLGQLYGRTAFYASGSMDLLQNLTAGVLVCAIMKLLLAVGASALVMTIIFKSAEGLSTAAEPMEVLAMILSGWVQEEHECTITELHAWSLARRSLCHNEVAFILDRFDNLLLGFVAAFFMSLGTETVCIVFWNAQPTLALWFFIFVVGTGALLCLKCALKVYYAQVSHIDLLRELHRHLMVFPRPHTKTRVFIKELIESLKKADYKAKIMYINLDPKVHTAILSYTVSCCVAIVGKQVVGSS